MLKAAISFFLMGLFSFIFGSLGFLGVTADVGKVFLLLFFTFTVLSLLAAMVVGKSRDKFV